MQHRTAIPYRPDIDGLRALAVAVVLVFHLNPGWLRGGFVGVDVFFVISGFLIFSITRRELADQTFNLVQFYGRRVRRLFPALLLMLATALGLGWFVMSAGEYEVLGRHVAAAVLYLSNFAYWRESGYFDANAELKPLLHLWSLAIEEQFYLVWPVLAAWIARSGRRFAPWTIGVLLTSLIGCVILTSLDRTAAFYASPVRFWEILVGCALALEVAKSRGSARSNAASWLGLTLIVYASVRFGGEQRFPGARALLPTLGAALLIGAGPGAWLNRRVLAARPAVWLGRISYPLYLWHWPVIVFLRMLAPAHRESLFGLTAAVGLSLLLAQLTHSCAERPARRLDPRRTAWWMMAPWLGFGLIGLTLWNARGIPARTPDLNAQLADVGERPRSYYQNEHCPAEIRRDNVLTFCRQAKAGPPTHVVIGDSHANHVFEAVRGVEDQNWLVLGNPVCAPVFGVRVETGAPKCEEGLRQMLDFVRRTPSVRNVVVSFYGLYASVLDAAGRPVVKGGRPAYEVGEKGASEEQRYATFERGLEAFLVEVERLGRPVIVAHDVPDLLYVAQDCVRRPFAIDARVACVQSRDFVDARQARYRAMMTRVLARHPAIAEYDPIPRLCDAQSCYGKGEGGPYYMDRHHVGERGSLKAFGGLSRVARRLESK